VDVVGRINGVPVRICVPPRSSEIRHLSAGRGPPAACVPRRPGSS